MTFAWTDRFGQPHQLETVEPIQQEVEQVSREIDAMLPMLTGADRPSRDAARRAIAPLQVRLTVLAADIERWNAQVHAGNVALARVYVAHIAALPVALRAVRLVVALHDEHERLIARTAADPASRAAALDEVPTVVQRAALDASTERVPLRTGANRADVYEALQQRPQFARARADTSGWFAWTDRHGHAHRLADPLPVEREAVTLGDELALLSRTLNEAGIDPAKLFATLGEAASRLQRLTVVQADLERFQREADARDLSGCQQFAADWRNKRKNA